MLAITSLLSAGDAPLARHSWEHNDLFIYFGFISFRIRLTVLLHYPSVIVFTTDALTRVYHREASCTAAVAAERVI